MTLTRRDFLKIGALTATATAATSCSVVARETARQALPEELATPPPAVAPAGDGGNAGPAPATIDPTWRLLSRAGYGPRPGELAAARDMGRAAWLEWQLAPAAIEDTAAELFVRGLTVYNMDISQLIEQEPRDAAAELMLATFMRALTSRRQLYEVMVEFWSDHFNIYLRKNQTMPLLKVADDRDVIRPHALGRFRDLLGASARSQAMLVYLDNVRNEPSAPNENYARELMELHTLGVDGGYTQQDVAAVARILTGWTVARRGRDKGETQFMPAQHDDGVKTVLGETFPAGGGEAELERLLDLLAAHPSTAQFIATRLVRRFVADAPPADLVAAVAQTYRESGGDIKAMLRTLFLSDALATAPAKLKRPYTFAVSALRVLGADVGVRQARVLADWLNQMGQPLFLWPPPDGYPDVATAWVNNLLPRWNFSLALLTGQLPGINVPLEELARAGGVDTVAAALDLFAGLMTGRALPAATEALLTDYVGPGPLSDNQTRQNMTEALALLLASPAFQWT